MLTPQNAALVIIDFQPVQVTSVASMDRRVLVSNVVAVAKTAKLYGLPVVLSHRQREDWPQPADHSSDQGSASRRGSHRPHVDQRVGGRRSCRGNQSDRTQETDHGGALDGSLPGLSGPGRAQGRLRGLSGGRAVAGTSLEAHRAGLERIVQAGAKPTSWVQLICELQRDWLREATVPGFAEIVFAVEGN